MNNDAFAEVIESSLNQFRAQCWEWNFFPAFGSLVQVQTKELIMLGVVCQIETGAHDPMRYPFPYKKTEEELMSEQPQIFEFLKTTFQTQMIGYIDKENGPSDTGKIYYLLPPKPCKIHAFVGPAPKEIITRFFSEADYLHLLFSFAHQIPNLDELLLSLLQKLKKDGSLSSSMLALLCSQFSLLSGNDYRRTKLFMGRVQRIVA